MMDRILLCEWARTMTTRKHALTFSEAEQRLGIAIRGRRSFLPMPAPIARYNSRTVRTLGPPDAENQLPKSKPIRSESVTRAAQRGPTSVNRVIPQPSQVLAGLVLGALGQRAVEAFDQKRQSAAEVRQR